MTTQSPTPNSSVRQVVVVAHGPARVTKGACRRARSIAGADGVVAVVAADRPTRKIVDRLGTAADLVGATSGSDGLLAVLGRLGAEPTLLLHDDASIEPVAVAEACAQLGSVPGVVAPVGSPDGSPFALLGTPAELSDRIGGADRPVLDGRGLAVAEVDVRHDGRCGTADAATPAPRVPLVVATLIVRDEAANIASCLDSLSGFVDRVVVCDTGSSDDTVSIARERGATVVEREWRDDFAWARNEALTAIDAAEWVLWVDADERLVCPDPAVARLQLRGEPADVRALAVEVRSRRLDGPTSVGVAQRLFRLENAVFRGAIHEEVVDGRTSEPLRTAPTGIVSVEHLGYALSAAELQAKAQRNLDIAQHAFDVDPSPKAALDLSRSLAYASQGLDAALSAAQHGVELATAGDPLRTRLLSTSAGFLLELDRPEEAWSAAVEVIGAEPGDDVAALVLAEAGSRLGRDQDVVAAIDRDIPTGSSLRIPVNRLRAGALAAAAAARLGDPATTMRILNRTAALVSEAGGGWPVVLDAVGAPLAGELEELAASLDATERDELIAAAYESLPMEVADRLARRDDIPVDTAGGGITLSFGLSPTPIAASTIAEAVPPRRRVLEWGGGSELTSLLRERSSEITTLEEGSSPLTQLARLRAEGRWFDVAVGALGPDDGPSVLEAIRLVLDPAGATLLWEVDGSGTALTGHTPGARQLLTGEGHAATFANAGFIADPLGPRGVTLLRPMIGADVQIPPHVPGDPNGHLLVVTPAPLSTELELAHRVSLPGDRQISFTTSEGLDDFDASTVTATLVTDPAVLPEPRWLQALWDWVEERGEPAGARLVDQFGTCVHAGISTGGALIGHGDPVESPLLRTDRDDCGLAVPFVSPGICRTATGVGHMMASTAAVTVAAVEPSSATAPRTTELFSQFVLLLDGPAPGGGHPDERAAVDKILRRLCEAGVTPVYQWSDSIDPVDAHIAQRWRTLGVVLVPPSPDRYTIETFRPDVTTPRADALATALRPTAIAYFTPQSIEWDFQSLAGQVPDATVVYCGPPVPLAEERADVCCSIEDAADALLDTTPRATTHEPEIASIKPVAAQPATVSIVIPVHNRWDLTEACLRSIAAHTTVDHEIIIVDNGSTDETAAALRSLDVTVVQNRTNRGFPAAVNQGIQASSGEFVCVLNNDTEVTEGWIEGLQRALAVPGTGMVGPRSNRIAGLQRIPDGPAAADPAVHEWAARWVEGRDGRTWEISRLIGFCLLLRRDVLEEIGGFDEGFGIGNYEDDELGDRLRASGRTLRVADDVVVVHHGSATFTALGLDYAAVMHSSSRHLVERNSAATGPTTVIVLSDGDSVGAAASAASALAVADHIRIVERRAVVSTELAVAAIRGGRIEVLASDWSTEAGAAGALEGLGTTNAVVLGAGELVTCPDWGAARAELATIGSEPTEVLTPDGSEVRVVPPVADAIGIVGANGSHRIGTFRLTSERAATG
jgi:GT2 family glycosyltransferase